MSVLISLELFAKVISRQQKSPLARQLNVHQGVIKPDFSLNFNMFVCFDSLCPSQHFFTHAWVEPVLSRG